MITYSPFNKALKHLEPADLTVLTHANEGWYIEYKREVPNAASIAKSISAFANTYGGWLFYGIEEKSKDDSVAGSFPGIARREADAVLQRIRQAIATSVAPSPHFDLKVLWGRCDKIGLAADRGIICVYVPRSVAAPHVHIDGRIYRRVADGSEPKPENDRFVLDQLWHRADDLRAKYKEWVERDQEFSEAELEQPYLRVLLVPDLWGDRGLWSELSAEEVRATMSGTGRGYSLPFDTVYTSATGFVARQDLNNDPHNLSLTWRLSRDLRSEILVPLRMYAPNDVTSLREALHGYEAGTRFAQLLKARGFRTPRIVDLNVLLNVLWGIVEMQDRFLQPADWKDGYFYKLQLLNVWRTCPFVDVTEILDLYEAHGVPMCLHSTTISPAGTDPETFGHISAWEDADEAHEFVSKFKDNELARLMMQGILLFGEMAHAYGLPIIIEDNTGLKTAPIEQMRLAGERAMELQRRRREEAG